MALLDGIYIIKSTLTQGLVADLAGAAINNPIVGYHCHEDLNQQVYFFFLHKIV
jgi:hypothetical protein